MTSRLARFALTFAAAGMTALPALAQTAAPADPHAAHMAPAEAAPAATPASAVPASAAEAYTQAMDKMHKAMMVAPTGDADVDFVRGMIPHHQGAIDMARIQMQFGKDPELRALSEAVISAQEKEIAQMQAWLEKNAPDAARADAAKTESLSANPATGAPPEPAKPAN